VVQLPGSEAYKDDAGDEEHRCEKLGFPVRHVAVHLPSEIAREELPGTKRRPTMDPKPRKKEKREADKTR
jgi:hypothetical protein